MRCALKGKSAYIAAKHAIAAHGSHSCDLVGERRMEKERPRADRTWYEERRREQRWECDHRKSGGERTRARPCAECNRCLIRRPGKRSGTATLSASVNVALIRRRWRKSGPATPSARDDVEATATLRPKKKLLKCYIDVVVVSHRHVANGASRGSHLRREE